MEEMKGRATLREGELTASASFDEFFRREHVGLLRAMYLVTGSAVEAEEGCQEAFVRVWERWDRVQSLESPTGYLYRTAFNWHRSRARRARRSVGRALPWAPPRDLFAEADDRDEVVRALRRLAPRQRAALVVTELLGYDSTEAGQLLGVRP